MADQITLYDRQGRKYVTTDKVEATRLRMAHGYTTKAPKSEQPATKSGDKK